MSLTPDEQYAVIRYELQVLDDFVRDEVQALRDRCPDVAVSAGVSFDSYIRDPEVFGGQRKPVNWREHLPEESGT